MVLPVTVPFRPVLASNRLIVSLVVSLRLIGRSRVYGGDSEDILRMVATVAGKISEGH